VPCRKCRQILAALLSHRAHPLLESLLGHVDAVQERHLVDEFVGEFNARSPSELKSVRATQLETSRDHGADLHDGQ